MVSASTGYRCGRRAWPVLAALFVSASLAADAGAQGSAATDRAALLALYEASGGPSWRVRTNWLSDEPLGDWHGVATDAGGRVTVLSLEENGLTGTLSPEIGNLSHMRQVHLWGNALTGPVPAALWSLPLELVALTGSQVTGTLPPEVGDLVDLRWVDLGWTEMTGALPQSMTNLSLEYLRITGSYLCAPADDAFQAWLETIGEFDGQTCMPETGSVETDRAALVALYNATDGANWRNNAYWLSGRPLGEWYGVTTDGTGRVVELDLGFGELTRELPPEIGNLSRLRVLVLSDNFDLTGPLPPEMGNLRRLEILALTSTAFYGLLPASVCNLSNLGYLGLSWSEMRGPLPQCLTNLSELDSFNTWETFLCTPANVAFQTWLAGLSETSGIETCQPSTFTVAPVELQLRGAVAQLITVAQTGGGDPVMWTAVSTQPWLRVTPVASIGTGRVTVSADPVMLQAVDGPATGAIVVTADGASVRVRVTANREEAAAELSRPAIGPTVHVLAGRAGAGTKTARRAPERAMWRAHRASGRPRDDYSAQTRPRQETDDTPAGDRAALTAFYDATGGDNWWRDTHWLSDRPLGKWYGVTTDSGGRVTALELSDNRLTGAVPDVLGSLTRLELLDLSRNALAGGIPAALGELAGLRQLNLGFNELTGAIPPGLGNLSNLESLSLHWNQFRTPIPPELGNLNRLEVLNLEYALVTGQIPSALGNLANLTVLDLRDNFALTGPIPAALGNLTSLEWLGLGGNRLEGAIPSVLGRLTNLRTLSLSNNLLSGGIPPELGDLSNLGDLGLHNNSLTGTIPPELGRLSDLISLELHENALTGPIPASLRGTSLYWLFLYDNELTGSIPPELGEIENLQFLHLQDNTLSGSIPSALGELDNLKVLDLRNNALTGPIPATLGQLGNLEVIDLSDNELAGPIPGALGDLSDLWWLDVRDNALTGPIPSELGGLSELIWLDLAGNGLTGPIPSELGALERLAKLSLWRNDLTGSIPRTLGTLSRLEQLYLGENALTGSIPPELGNLTNLRQLYLAGNVLTGPIPAALGDLTNLEVLHFRNNQLTGPIPSALGALSNLGWLDVAENALTGMLPPALGSLSTLRALSLSGNRLTGPLPSELTMLPELDYLWIDETGLCAPADATFQTWLAALMQFSGVTCLDFAHFANGAGIISDLVFVNVATHPIRPVLYFYGQEGHLIDPESMVDLTEDLEVTEDGALSVRTEMEPLGELTISTHGRGEVVSGSVQVAADGPIGGVLRFDLPGIGVAGVGASQPVRDALFPARRQAGGIATAAAIRNLGEEALVVSCRLMSGGIVLEAVEISLEANGQEARYIEELFTGTDTSDFVGSVRCTAPGLFTGIAVELDAGNRIFTTLPVVPVARTGGGGKEAALDFAHFANGADIISDLVLMNVAPHIPVRPVLYFYDQEGHLIAPESMVDLTEDLEVTEDGALTVQTEMEPLGELTISTHGRGDLVSGSVQVASDGPIGGVLRFDLPGIGVAGVGASQPVRDALFPARRRGGLSTAAAIRNLGEEALVMSCRLMNGGIVLEEVEIYLEANGQDARFIEEMFTATDTSDFVGSVRCTAAGLFTGIAVELDAGNRIFTTLPVVPVQR